MKKNLVETVAARIRARRLALNWSQEALAEAADLHRTYIGAIERGEKNMTLTTLQRVAKALGVAPADLLRDQR
jgi:transcriptional regulator with XRE-family HTH domain